MDLFNWNLPQNEYTLNSDEEKVISNLEEKVFFRKKMLKREWEILIWLRTKHLLSCGENPNDWNLDKRRMNKKKK